VNKTAFYLAVPATLLAGFPAAAQTFLSEEQALHAVLGEGAQARKEARSLDPEARQRLEQTSGLRFPERSFTIFVGDKDGKPSGYTFIMNEIGKSDPITFMVGITPDRKVGEVVMMVFRESRGAEVREPRFMRQFRGKKVTSPLRVNDDILNYTGATLSSRAIARGVKKALLLLDVFYPEGSAQPARGAIIKAQPPVPLRTYDELGFYRQVRYRMGTECEVRLWADAPSLAGQSFDAAFRELARIDRIFSNYRPDSELALVNKEAGYSRVSVSGEMWRMLRFAARAWQETGGAIDVTVGPLVRAWGFHDRQPHVPTPEVMSRAGAQVGFAKVQMGSGRTVRFEKTGMEVDFGGLAKGYAVKRAGATLRRLGVKAASINLGESSIYFYGTPPLELPWVAAIRDPEQPENIARLAVLPQQGAISTSATYENCMLDATGRSHVFDCRSLLPVPGPRLATVLMQDALEAEVASKALLMGLPTQAEQWFSVTGGRAQGCGAFLPNDETQIV
jgi:FAD:protein FMN transferase